MTQAINLSTDQMRMMSLFQNDNTKEAVDDFIKNNLPMGKFGWAEPVGDLVAFLSSDRIGFMAGSCIVIDGGQSYSML